MICIEMKIDNDKIIGFHIEGHAGYDDYGKDIICSSVSVLAINCINSIKEFANADFSLDMNETTGLIDFLLKEKPNEKAELLLLSMLLGLQSIEETYGKKYIVVK